MSTYSKDWLENELITDRSKENVIRIATLANQNKISLDFIFELIELETNKFNWRAAWVLDHLNQLNSDKVEPFLNRIITFLPKTQNDSLRRTYLKIIGQYSLPPENEGVLMDECFSLLNNPQSAIAVRAWCIDILCKFLVRYPEIKRELEISLKAVIENGSAGEKNRATKALKTLDKES